MRLAVTARMRSPLVRMPVRLSGSTALIPTHSTKACKIAQDEIDAGKIAYVKKDVPVVKPLVEESGTPIIVP